MGVVLASVYLLILQVVFSNPDVWAKAQQGPPPAEVMTIFRLFIGMFLLWFLVCAVANLLSGLFMRSRRYRAFSMVVAGLNCLHIPLGTILGVFTLIVLGRESVGSLYETQQRVREDAFKATRP